MTVKYPSMTGNGTSMQDYFQYITLVTDGLFFPMILLVLWTIVFIATRNFGSSRGFTIASFFTTILSIPLALIGFTAPYIMYMSIAMTAGGILWLRVSRD